MDDNKRWVTLKDGRKILINDYMNNKIREKATKKELPNSTQHSDIAYHASNADFNEFDTTKIGTGQGENTQGNGINLASNDTVHGVYGNILYKVKVNLKNAYTVENKKLLSTFENDFGYKTDLDNVSNELRKMGYDGIVQKVNGNKLYTVFDSKNVKIIEKRK